MTLISFNEWREKHKKDYNHGKSGFVGGNPRYGKQNSQTHSGNPKNLRSVKKNIDRQTDFGQKEE